ncbi:MAG: hypothetical protein ABSF61_09115 [Anaerolineales bacterium]|jgi:hypothetical protein
MIWTPLLLPFFPWLYLLLAAQPFRRPALYDIQVGLMLLWILAPFLLDRLLKINFPHTSWMVISCGVL